MMNINKYTFFKYYPGLITKLFIFLRSIILLIEEVEKYIPEEGLIYDIGCGYGLTSLYIALKAKKRKILGIDIDEKKVNVANNNISRYSLSFAIKDLRKDKDIEPCNCVLMHDSLHHLPYNTQYELLLVCKGKLKKNGILLIKEIDNAYKVKLFITYVLDKIVTKNAKLYYISSKKLIYLLKDMGFEVQYKKLQSIWPYPHYLLICRV